MKKVFGLFAIILFMTSVLQTSATKVVVKEKEGLGRQCCTRSSALPQGGFVSITACAGSFLTSDTWAINRACKKADRAMKKVLSFQQAN